MTSGVMVAPPPASHGRSTDGPTQEDPTDLIALVDTHLAAWTEPDPARRADLIRLVWSPDGRLSDPPAEDTGHDGLDAVFTALQARFPGHRFRRTSGVDAHRGLLRVALGSSAPTAPPRSPASTSPRSTTTAASCGSPGSSATSRREAA